MISLNKYFFLRLGLHLYKDFSTNFFTEIYLADVDGNSKSYSIYVPVVAKTLGTHQFIRFGPASQAVVVKFKALKIFSGTMTSISPEHKACSACDDCYGVGSYMHINTPNNNINYVNHMPTPICELCTFDYKMNVINS